MDIVERLAKCVKDEHGQPLICYGCAHSAAYMLYGDGTLVEGTDFPGVPSGERPCCFCLRNPEWQKWQDDMKKEYGKGIECWYDGSKVGSIPMDCYYSLNMGEQMDEWVMKKDNKTEE